MYEFQWTLPGESGEHDIRLKILARSGWIGRKVLLLDRKTQYARSWFDGINHTFSHPEEPHRLLTLQIVPDTDTGRWRPQLSLEGVILPERTKNPLPPVPRRTRLIAALTGLTYLIMLMALIMLPHVWHMLDSGFGHSDTRMMVLEVTGPDSALSPAPRRQAFPQAVQARPSEPTIQTRSLPPAREGVPYATTLRAIGGTPFEGKHGDTPHYRWVINNRKLPEGLKADKNTGEIEGTPQARTTGSYSLTVRVFDNAYTPWTHIAPWIAPFAATAVCLLGFWNMRRWSVILFAVLILAQVVTGVADVWHTGLPLNVTGVFLQTLVFAVGARSFTRMR